MQLILENMMDEHDKVRLSSIPEITKRAIAILRENEPDDGYHLSFSGGKDSCVIKELATMAGVKFDAVYSNTTIDPPELVRFIKKHHSDVAWNNSGRGNMMHRVATRPGMPPTRGGRWCCQEYKEYAGRGRTSIFGVRADESPRRKKLWREVTETTWGDTAICPIVYWSDEQVWGFIRSNNVPYCELYDEGFTRLGCVGCPLASADKRRKEFERWPKMGANWKRAIIRNWENYNDVPNTKTGKPRHQAKYKSGEDYWAWWMEEFTPDIIRGECQSGLLWTNEAGMDTNEDSA